MALEIAQSLYESMPENKQSIYADPLPSMMFDENTNTAGILRELNRMRMRGICCDAFLSTNDGSSFRVHKVAMSWCSNYFRTLFTTTLNDKGSGEGGQNRKYFVIPNVSSTTLEKIIHFAYSGAVNITFDNVNELLPAADQFNVVGIVDECVKFMLRNMTPENCLGIWRFGKEYFMPQLENEARRYALYKFIEVSANSEEFLNLKVQDLTELLKDNALNTPNELFVWIAIKHWCQFQYNKRQQYIPTLVQCVRMALLSVPDFRQIMDDPRIFRHMECRVYIKMVSKYITNEVKDLSRIVQEKDAIIMFTPRYPYEVIFAVGGWSITGPTAIFEVYDCRADLWKMLHLTDCIYPRVYHQTVPLGRYLYVIGGSAGNNCLNSCSRFDTVTMKYEEVSPMQEKRCFLSSALLSDKMYAIGGYDGFDRLQTVEYYDCVENQWTYVSPMHERRSDASASTLRNRIFVVGGFDGNDFLKTAECYYVEFDQWFLLPPMIKCRSGVGCVAMDNAVYAIGGFDGERRLRSVEKYCIVNRQWFPTKAMKIARSNFAVALMEKKIYVMGGYDDVSDTTTDHAECFDPSKPQWRSIAPLNIGRSGLSTCTFSGFKDITPYVKDNKFRCLLKNVSQEETVDLDVNDENTQTL